ncbi:hypothetical protein [Polyangium aurulentum]|uniref:hypothetical protein n=1 Tax=Polyangium aurulentum TaxID=2567896 RepID=UPI0010AEE6A6|nr:hypothetical protein [Polyangium aurulentum]UQA54764.1 hypothetical protein E8A73_025685 [Polyangium aurulentum]
MDPRTYEINNLRILNDYLTQTIEVLARAQRINQQNQGLSHSSFGGQSVFGVQPVQQPGFEFGGLSHSPYTYPSYHPSYSNPYGLHSQIPWGGTPQTFVDPFVAQRGLSHTSAVTGTPWTNTSSVTGTPWTNWSPVAEFARQRELQSILARQQYEAMCRSFMGC